MSAVLNDAPTIRLADAAQFRESGAARSKRRRIRALLNIGNDKIVHGHIACIDGGKLLVSLPEPIDVDSECALFFGLSIEDQLYSIIGSGRVIRCAKTGEAQFQAELRFNPGDKKSRIALEQLFESHESSVIR